MESVSYLEVILFINLENDIKNLRKIILASKMMDEAYIDEYLENTNDNYDRFWYYLDDQAIPPRKLGPYTCAVMQGLIKSGVIKDWTIVWNPTLKTWKAMAFAKALDKIKTKIDRKVIDEAIMILKRKNSYQPVFLKQGYLYIGKNKKNNLWKSRWVVMTKDALVIYTSPQGILKKQLSMFEMVIKARLCEEKNNDIVFDINVSSDQNLTYSFWSPFQKEIIEWINELRKLYELVMTKGNTKVMAHEEAKFNKYIIQPTCNPDEINLIVS